MVNPFYIDSDGQHTYAECRPTDRPTKPLPRRFGVRESDPSIVLWDKSVRDNPPPAVYWVSPYTDTMRLPAWALRSIYARVYAALVLNSWLSTSAE